MKKAVEAGLNTLINTVRSVAPKRLKRHQLARFAVHRFTRGCIVGGPFSGMRYVDTSIGSRFYPKLLGTYELELQETIETLCGQRFDAILDIGAAEGYYAVGMAMRCPQALVIAAESEQDGRDLVLQLAQLNQVQERVSILGHCDQAVFKRLVDENTHQTCLIVMDIEGGEIDLLDPSSVPQLNTCTILVEVHDGQNTGPIGDELIRRFGETHEITRTWYSQRTIENLPLRLPFMDLHLLSLLDEGRKYGLCWMLMVPRANRVLEDELTN